MGKLVRHLALLAVSLYAAGFLRPAAVIAEGALAVGIAPRGPDKGYATGHIVNEPDKDTAQARALSSCRNSYMASGEQVDQGMHDARTRCEVVATFRDKCLAVALDPKDGVPGSGWAIGDTQKDADDEALSRCRITAGSGRRGFCKVFDRKCDGTAK